MAPAQTVEEFRVATRSLLKLLGAGKPLTEVEESTVAAKIDALRLEFPGWKQMRTRMPRVGVLIPPPVLPLARAEKLIMAEWRTWAQKRRSYTITDMQVFYFSWLKKRRPELLTFTCRGDQWQVVREWLEQDEDSQVKLRTSQV